MDSATKVSLRFLGRVVIGKSDPLWLQWLESQHQGGKSKVPNPNPETRERFKEVSFSTALRDDAFKSRALKEFEAWKGKQEEQGLSEAPAKKEPKPKSAPKKKLTPVEKLDAGDALFSKVSREQVRKAVQDLRETGQSKKKARIESEHTSPWAKSYFEKMDETDTFLHFAAAEVGEYFKKNVLPESIKHTHGDAVNGWTGSSTGTEGYTLSAAVENLGFFGSLAEGDDTSEYKEQKRMTKGNTNYNSWLQAVHTFQQEVFREMGVKEITLYRGVQNQDISAVEGRMFGGIRSGDAVTMDTRAASSYSHDPRIAAKFGTVLKYKVPVENIILSPMVAPELGSAEGTGSTNFGEAEFVVMGASMLEGEMTDLHQKIPKSASEGKKKAVKIPNSKANEDWIRTMRKSKKYEKSASEVEDFQDVLAAVKVANRFQSS